MLRVYDTAGQLLQQKEIVIETGEVISQFDFEYDAVGNIIKEKATHEPDIAINLEMTYAVANRLATYDDSAVQLDADGNITLGPLSGDMVDFAFDSHNRLMSAGETVYHYDAENQRIGVNQTQYVVNSQPALSQVLVKTEINGTKTYYVYGLGLIGQEQGGEYLSYHFDFRGSTVALTDETGQVIERFQYSPYGLLLNGEVSITPFLFNGKYGVMTDASGLYYMRARYYHPEIRRFVNQDVLLGNINEGQTLNRYAYVTGQPVSFVDPFGLTKCVGFDKSGKVQSSGGSLVVCLLKENFGWIIDLELFQPGPPPHGTSHINRNKLNRCPQSGPTESEIRYLWPFGTAFTDCEGNAWKYDLVGAWSYHGLSEGNMSYRRPDPNSPNNGFQCVYDTEGERVTTVPFMGSYDYHAPGSPIDIYIHRKYDVNPHNENPNYPENPDLTEEYCTCSQ